ncbi:beta-ketoacyl-[acyl-carrier-protein] synthase family protein [Xanthovirga aplysinae]|uniref:beta-ketoacyl-[acyl-carrier-protein] synthase family protein n=1 Tax=Xanthovirga aplysinae TaxID=2529853 RepID=UPI0012BB4DE4|nr:beta-ketoacyl-[acyl-carrier-protein] synthase family protein [Xanthovirga aplysinae]MTI32988.1 beta-ketoacyl-[acyl-carrier-protein] synthase family protein [Xanthovirga aplysinae]
MTNRVVVTGLGVVSPNGVGISDFTKALKAGISGISFQKDLSTLKFGCQVAGIPQLSEDEKNDFIKNYHLVSLKSSGILYGCMAATESWKNAGLPLKGRGESEPDWDSGCIFGTGISGIEAIAFGLKLIEVGKVRKLGGRVTQQVMSSGISAYVGGIIGCGNQVTTNSSACSTGTEAIIEAFYRIKFGMAKRMIAGSCDSEGPYVWGGFDSMRVLNRTSNHAPTKASRPMSKSATGFVPGAGAGALVLESLDSALERNANIYAEIVGGSINSGGQRGSGTMTAPNRMGIIRCIKQALKDSKTSPEEIDLICGHLTSTMGDPIEVAGWSEAMGRKKDQFPYINSLKSMVGHCLSAAGSVESVAAVLQLKEDFVHPSLNCEDLHPEIEKIADPKKILNKAKTNVGIHTLAKASFGFGDVNSCVIIRKWEG